MDFVKKMLFLTMVFILGSAYTPSAFAEGDQHKSHHQEQAKHDHHDKVSAKHDAVMGKAIIHSIDLENRKINLSHEPIPALKWPQMTMDMDVAENVDIASLEPEQNILFHIELGADKIYRITQIMEADDHQATQQCVAGMDCPMQKNLNHAEHAH
ncbi:MAG: copper-binding protein [Pseudomonadota bacterium]|jgi:Cu/Ag efflux protein CusF|nr:hypothetical protein [Pseudomonadota bacterium]QKK04263.1 MAG: copper-binding protein [Pseudomonadota bacterium]